MALAGFLQAIVNDDPASVRVQLAADDSLATRLIARPRLYRAKIFHWLYAGDTALHLAAAGYRVEIVRLLLAAGADPNAAANHRHSTPLHYAADGCPGSPAWDEGAQLKTIRCLLDHGAALDAPDKNGATPLHRAVRTRCAAAVRCLLEAGADPKLRNRPGSTPFHLAVQNTGRGGSGVPAAIEGQRRIIRTFRSFGVSPLLENAHGKTVRASAQSAWILPLLA
jgi:hypothetical protein